MGTDEKSQKEIVLALLYTDLGFKTGGVSEQVKDFISECVDDAQSRLEKDGVNVETEDASLRSLWRMYAAYLYRHRNSEKPMPMSLRLALNDARVAAATAGEATT